MLTFMAAACCDILSVLSDNKKISDACTYVCYKMISDNEHILFYYLHMKIY